MLQIGIKPSLSSKENGLIIFEHENRRVDSQRVVEGVVISVGRVYINQ